MNLVRSLKSVVAVAAALPMFVASGAFLAAPAALADTVDSQGFENFALGTPNGQFGWTVSPSGNFDEEIADPSAAWGTQLGNRALRVSNAVTSGSFGNQLFSAPNTDEAGETSAASDGYSGGTRQSRFSGSFTFASATPGAYQPGLAVGISPDRGDGARMALFRIYDTPTGLELTMWTYDPSTQTFSELPLAQNLDRSRLHSFSFHFDFVDGPDNDIFTSNIDGCRAERIGTWEDYHRDVTPGNPTKTVDSLLIRMSGPAQPALAGAGLYLDDVVTTTGPSPTPLPTPPGLAVPDAPTGVTATGTGPKATVTFDPAASPCTPVTGYTVTATPAHGPAVVVSGTGTSYSLPGLEPGKTYTIVVTADNANGTSAPSVPTTYTVPHTPPGPPTHVQVTVHGTTAHVTFQPPVDHGSRPIRHYVVTLTPVGGGHPIVVRVPNLQADVPGLAPGTKYRVTVRAYTGVAGAADSAPVVVQVPAAEPGGGVDPVDPTEPPAPPQDLADTGANLLTPTLLVGVVLVLVGAGAVAASRRPGLSRT